MAQSIRDNTKTRKRPEGTGKFVGVRAQPELLDMIDKWRRKQADLPNRPEAIRRLVKKALGGMV